MKRSVKPIMLGDTLPSVTVTEAPVFEMVAPASLFVDEEYQRCLSEKSIRLIRKIVSGWDWARFKPPVVARTDAGLEVIDGQHTAIAAASHPSIDTIPVMIVRADTQADRAKSFVGHNKDRLGITPMQMHYSALAAGDEAALTIQQVCDRAGVKILKTPPANGAFKAGETVAIAAIGALINRRFAKGAREVLQVLSEARCAPVAADLIKAADTIMHDDEYAGQVDGADLVSTIIRLGPDAFKDAKLFAAAHRVPVWKALAVTLFKNTRKRRRVA